MKLNNRSNSSRIINNNSHNVANILGKLSIGSIGSTQCKRQLQVTPNLINRLALEGELWGHYGCVNCLEWNESGSILASGSDDQDVMLWNPFSRKQLKTVSTGHTGNIFSVKFLPHSNDTIIATGAGDRLVKVFDTSVNDTLLDCSCHTGRVKRIATVGESPYLLWSAGEDGKVLQFDLRQPHTCNNGSPYNTLITLSGDQNGSGNDPMQSIEAKCVAVNSVRTELLAVGANDPFVRLYDRRYINTRSQTPSYEDYSDISSNLSSESARSSLPPTSVENNTSGKGLNGCVSFFAPGHLHDQTLKAGTFSSTYVTFSPDGRELLANIGAEHVYLYNVITPRERFRFQRFKQDAKRRCNCLQNHQANTIHEQQQRYNNRRIHNYNNNYYKNNNNNNNNNSDNNDIMSRNHFNCLNQKYEHRKQHNLRASRRANSVTSATANEAKLKATRKIAKLQIKDNQCCKAIQLCNELIQCREDCNEDARLFKIRAEAYACRAWRGDLYAAVRDASLSITLDPTYWKAHIQLIRSLKRLDWYAEAWKCFDLMLAIWADHGHDQKLDRNEVDRLREELHQPVEANDKSLRGSDESDPEMEILVNDPISGNLDLVILRGRDTYSLNSSDGQYSRRNSSQERYPNSYNSYDFNDVIDDQDDDHHHHNNNSGSESGHGSAADCVSSIGSIDHEAASLHEITSSRDANRGIIGNQLRHDYDSRYCGHCNTTTDIKEANFFGANGQYIVAGSDDGAFYVWDKHTSNLVKAFKGDDQIVNCLQPHPEICMLATSGIDHVVRLWSPSGTGRDREIIDMDHAAATNQQRMSCDLIEALFMFISAPRHFARD